MTIITYIRKFEAKFKERIEQKTGWGKNEIMIVFQDVRQELLEEILEEEMK